MPVREEKSVYKIMATRVDFKYNDGSRIFFTSDTHGNHESIIKFCNRPFQNVEEMNKTLINNWNAKVGEDDLVFHLGDFAWGGSGVWKHFREQLNGHIILIKGNHDVKQMSSTTEMLFDNVTQQMYIEIEGQKIYLNHYPLLCYAGTYRSKDSLVWALNGHTHIGPLSTNGLDFERMKLTFPTQYDVGVDMNNFEPISFHELQAKMNYQIKKNTNMMCWI